MKRVLLFLGASLCMVPNAFAADAERGISVFDANPKCMERSTPPNHPECILWQEGAPRQFYPPAVSPALPNPPVMPPTPPVAREGSGNNARGGG